MTARDRLLRVQRELGTVYVLRLALIMSGVAMAAYALSRAAGAPERVANTLWTTLAVLAALLPSRALVRTRSLERVALWVEEECPAMQYAVVTLAARATTSALEAQALAFPWWSHARRAMLRTLAWPMAGALAGALLLLALPSARVAQRIHAAPAGRGGGASERTDPLARLHVTVTPPSYTGREAASSDDPTSVAGLAGSVVTVNGTGDATLVSALLDSSARPVTRDNDAWSVRFAMPVRPALLRLHARGASHQDKLLVLAPVIDAPPAVTLLLPARDTVVRAATGTLALRAELRDDIGLRDARFEIVISSGQDESFTFRSTVVAAAALHGAAEHILSGRIPLDSLALKPGDVLQLRAVARDANDVTGPGVGSSETRALRVARAGEYDSVSVDAAPPGDPEGQVLSQRMLITLTEALERRRTRLARPTLLAESQRIATDQARLRKRVGDVVFQRLGGEPLGEESGGVASGGKVSPDELLKRAEEATRGSASDVMDVEGDETPILALNKPLLEAFNAMWDAGRALEQGETNRALPPMRRALAAIERARQAERIYLRGRPAAVIVDLNKARLQGKEHGASAVLPPRPPMDPASRRRAESFARATALLSRDAAAAADTLLVMRVDALESAPALAAALDDASRAARRGDATATALAWQRVRRALGPAPVRGDAAGLWSGAP